MATDGLTGRNEFFEFLSSGLEMPGEFQPSPYYDHEADILFFYARDVPSYAKRLNAMITLILATEDNSLVGVKIKSVRRMLVALKDIEVHVIDHKIKLKILIALAMVVPPEDPQLETSYEDDFGQFDNVEIDKSELAGAC